MNRVTKTSIAKFGEHMRKGVEHMYEACKIYADAVAKDHTVASEFEKAYPYITATTWDKFRLVGVNAIEPKVLLLSDRLGSKIARLPIKDQRKIVGTKIKVATKNRVTEKDIRDMSEAEQKRVFDKNMNVRSVEKQRQVIFESEQAKKHKKVVPYVVDGTILKVSRACIISKKELKAILARMK